MQHYAVHMQVLYSILYKELEHIYIMMSMKSPRTSITLTVRINFYKSSVDHVEYSAITAHKLLVFLTYVSCLQISLSSEENTFYPSFLD